MWPLLPSGVIKCEINEMQNNLFSEIIDTIQNQFITDVNFQNQDHHKLPASYRDILVI